MIWSNHAAPPRSSCRLIEEMCIGSYFSDPNETLMTPGELRKASVLAKGCNQFRKERMHSKCAVYGDTRHVTSAHEILAEWC